MSNTGKFLEGFVEQIERTLLPQGITLSVNEKVFNDQGVQIAEFDIEIEGKVGSTNFKWLIECRDRPSQGAAPGSWIEQLVGRRNRFGFDKVIAVSTTGFAPGAEEFANKTGIEVRTVTESEIDQISDWFLFDKMTVFKRGGNLENAKLLIDKNEPEKLSKALQKELKNNCADTPILRSTETGEKITVGAAFQSAVTNSGLHDGPFLKEGSKKVNLKATYPRDDSHFVVETDEGIIRIREILFRGELSIVKEEVPIAAIKNYKNVSTDEDIATKVSFNFDVDGKALEMSFNKIAESGETHVLLGAATESNGKNCRTKYSADGARYK